MRISLFTCTAEKERVNKEEFISNEFPLDGTLRDMSSVIDPVILIEKTNPTLYNYNYMYIGDFGRWYYIREIISVTEKLWEIHAHVDVLFSWRTSILANKAIISKSETFEDGNMYLNDGSFVLDSRKYTQVKQFPNGFSDTGTYILICAGGSTNAS